MTDYRLQVTVAALTPNRLLDFPADTIL